MAVTFVVLKHDDVSGVITGKDGTCYGTWVGPIINPYKEQDVGKSDKVGSRKFTATELIDLKHAGFSAEEMMMLQVDGG